MAKLTATVAVDLWPDGDKCSHCRFVMDSSWCALFSAPLEESDEPAVSRFIRASECLAAASSAVEIKIADALDEFGLSVRAQNCLVYYMRGIQTLGDLAAKRPSDILRTKNAGRKTLEELQGMLRHWGLDFLPDRPRQGEVAGG